MSQVFERNRKEADSDYLSLAVDIRIEVLSLVMREGVVPKRKRLILGAPALSPVSWPPRKAAVRAPMLAVRGALHELRR